MQGFKEKGEAAQIGDDRMEQEFENVEMAKSGRCEKGLSNDLFIKLAGTFFDFFEERFDRMEITLSGSGDEGHIGVQVNACALTFKIKRAEIDDGATVVAK